LFGNAYIAVKSKSYKLLSNVPPLLDSRKFGIDWRLRVDIEDMILRKIEAVTCELACFDSQFAKEIRQTL